MQVIGECTELMLLLLLMTEETDKLPIDTDKLPIDEGHQAADLGRPQHIGAALVGMTLPSVRLPSLKRRLSRERARPFWLHRHSSAPPSTPSAGRRSGGAPKQSANKEEVEAATSARSPEWQPPASAADSSSTPMATGAALTDSSSTPPPIAAPAAAETAFDMTFHGALEARAYWDGNVALFEQFNDHMWYA